MKLTFILLLTITLSRLLPAQELQPELRPVVMKYQADVAELEERQSLARTRSRQPYLAALGAAEAKATAAGQIPLIAAITRECEAVREGKLGANFPAELPKLLVTARKGCVDAEAKTTRDVAAIRQRLDAEHLRSLAALHTRALVNPELAKQIAAEKAAILGTVPVKAEPKTAFSPPAQQVREASLPPPKDLVGSTWDYRGGAVQMIRFIDEEHVERWMAASPSKKEHGTYRLTDGTTLEIAMAGEAGLTIICKMNADFTSYDGSATGEKDTPAKLWKYVGMKFKGSRIR